MIGAIIGDIVGSRYEFHNHRSKDFQFFSSRCEPTDDSIMTLAIASAITACARRGNCGDLKEETIQQMQSLGRKYPDRGWGARFGAWIRTSNPQPYGSFGNGAAMRVSAIVAAAPNLETAKIWTRLVTEISHNHPEGIKGAMATVELAMLAKSERAKGKAQKSIAPILAAAKRYYPEKDFLNEFHLDAIRPYYRFDETCQGSVPQAIEAFLEAKDYEDAIRNAISIGGDSDTLAAITGTIAEAYFGVKNDMKKAAMTYLDGLLYTIYNDFVDIFGDLPVYGKAPGEIVFDYDGNGNLGGISTMGDTLMQ